MHAAFRSPLSKPTLVLISGILITGAMSGVSLFNSQLIASYTAGLSSPEFVVDGNHAPELRLIFLGIVGGSAYAFFFAFASWIG